MSTVMSTVMSTPYGDAALGVGAHPAAPAPECVTGGLAVYACGGGEPALLFPDPGGLTLGPPAAHPLAGVLDRFGRTALTFDPPGSYRSSRRPLPGMPQLVGCAHETLDVCGAATPVDVLGHGAGALGALAFAVAAPQRVRRLVLVGGVSGFDAVRRFHGVPYCWPATSPQFWRFVWWDRVLGRGRGNLAQHKRLLRLHLTAEYGDDGAAPATPEVLAGDRQRPAPLRDQWLASVRGLDYRAELTHLFRPVLVCVGRQDMIAPVAAARELTSLLPDASLVVFERSGHRPFEEEPRLFETAVGAFLHHGELYGETAMHLSHPRLPG
jgi:pimeloyl-ACP methyl ester carboxylesterase